MRWANRRSRVGYRRGAASALLVTLAACTTPALPRLEHALAAQDSATAALQAHCPVPIRAERVQGKDASAPEGLSALLASSAAAGYRHVRLACAGVVLSEAHNWFVPERLAPGMNAALAASDTPFGKVAAPLGFRRERLLARRGRDAGCPAGTVLSHRALLRLPSGEPLALVLECYTRASLR